MSALIFELLDGAEPVLDRVVRLLETAELAKEQMHGHLTRNMESAQERIEHQFGLTLSKFGDDQEDLLSDLDISEYGNAPQRRARKGGRLVRPPATSAEPTPLSNRGVRSLTKAVNKTSTRLAK